MPRVDRDSAGAAELDAVLDALGVGASSPRTRASEIGELAAIARRIEALSGADTAMPASIAVPGWSSIRNQASSPPLSRAIGASRRTPDRRSRWQIGIGELATAAMLLLILVGGFAIFASEHATRRAADGSPVQVYVTAEDQSALTPLDPVTLWDAPGAVLPFAATPGAPSWEQVPEGYNRWLASLDGSTLVSLTESIPFGSVRTAVVFDLPSGRERSRFSVIGGNELGSSLSPDGRRLLVSTGQQTDHETRTLVGLPRWATYATATGELQTEIAADLPAPAEMFAVGVVDWSTDRLYALSVASDDALAGPGPWPTRITAYDLISGTVLKSVELPKIQGWYARVETSSLFPESLDGREFIPALALSPDGRMLGIVDGSSADVTFVRASDLQVEQTVSLSPLDLDQATSSPLELDGETVPLFAVRIAAFTPDGERLLVSGFSSHRTDTEVCGLLSGLVAVDADDGTVTETGIGGWMFPLPQPATDDLFLWVLGATEEPEFCEEDERRLDVSEPLDATAFRLDAATLVPEASRTFEASVQLVVVPARSVSGATAWSS